VRSRAPHGKAWFAARTSAAVRSVTAGLFGSTWITLGVAKYLDAAATFPRASCDDQLRITATSAAAAGLVGGACAPEPEAAGGLVGDVGDAGVVGEAGELGDAE
jgi:hypothetical protein